MPCLTRNGHLGHYASQANPHYFEANQLYRLKSDPEEHDNVFRMNPEAAERAQQALAQELKKFEERPFGEFTN